MKLYHRHYVGPYDDDYIFVLVDNSGPQIHPYQVSTVTAPQLQGMLKAEGFFLLPQGAFAIVEMYCHKTGTMHYDFAYEVHPGTHPGGNGKGEQTGSGGPQLLCFGDCADRDSMVCPPGEVAYCTDDDELDCKNPEGG